MENTIDNSHEARKKYLIAHLEEDNAKLYRPATESILYRSPYHKPFQSVPPALERFFKSMDIRQEGRITSKDLQYAFETFQGKHFSDATCKFVVRLFDLDRNGGLNIKEFETLYFHMKQWVAAFNTYDREKNGTLDESELEYAFKLLDVQFSPEFIHFLVTKNNTKNRRMSLEQFIMICIQIQKFTEEFKNRDDKFSGKIVIGYEEFLELLLKCFM